jgi:signal transduction histidine kinase
LRTDTDQLAQGQARHSTPAYDFELPATEPAPGSTADQTTHPAASHDAIVTLDPDSRVTFWSSEAELLYGIDAEATLGRCFTDLVSNRPVPPGRKERPGLSSGQAIHVVRAGGRTIPVRVTVIPDPRRLGGDLLAIIRDDSEHLLLARTLRERLEFETLLSEMSARLSGVPEDDIDGQINQWLGRLVEMLDVDRSSFAELTPQGRLTVTHSYAVPGVAPYPKGVVDQTLPWLTQELAAGRTVLLAQIPQDLPECAVAERRVMTDVGMRASIGIPVFIGGSLVCVLTFGAFRQPRTWSGEVVSRLHLAGEVFANAVARRQAKRRLEQKQQELTHVGRVADMAKLASVIAHELDQPLTAVVTNAHVVRNMLQTPEPDLAEADDALSDVIDAAMRASEIVERERRLLCKSQGAFELINLNDALREVELFIRADARRCGARVTLELLPDLPALLGDRVQLQQVALNLARNAIQAVRQQPGTEREVSIRTAAGIGEVAFSVTDSGPPVEESLLERMFDPFFSTKPDGLGIGLSISKSIVEGHRGRIWPTRNPGGGLTVHVSIPRT